MKRKKKQILLLAMSGLLTLGGGMTALADYEEIDYFDGNLEYNNRLYESIERNNAELEEAEKTIAELEEKLEELEPQYMELEEAYETEMAKTGVKDMNLVVEYKAIKQKYGDTKNKLASAKKVYERAKKKADTLDDQLKSVTEKALTFSGQYDDEDKEENTTIAFNLERKNGDWVLYAGYRSWNPLMGGQWEYSSIITERLDIDFYDGNSCLESSLARANEYDTESCLYWDVPDDLEIGKKYYIELNGSRFSVYANDFNDAKSNNSKSKSVSTSAEADNDDFDESDDMGEEEKTETTVTVTYSWASNDIGWWIQGSDSSYLVNQWYCSPVSGLWYYMGADGYMMTNTTTPDGYFVNAEGVWVQ